MLRKLSALIFVLVLSSGFLVAGWVSSKEISITSVQADFFVSPIAGPPPLPVQFINQSTGDYETCLWDLGEELREICDNVSHVYTVNGSYTISLTVSGPGGEDTLIREDYVIVDDQLPEPVLPPWENMGIYGGGARDGVVEPDTDRVCISGGGWPYFYCSENSGASWEGIGPGFGAGGSLELLDGTYYGLFEATVYSSTNRGYEWGIVVDGADLNYEAYPSGFDINTNDRNHLVITAFKYIQDGSSTIYYTDDGGEYWEEATYPDPYPGLFLDVAINPTNDGQDVYAVSGNSWFDLNLPSHIYKSTNGGESFNQVFTPTVGTQMSVVAVNYQGVIYAGSNQGLYRSETGDKDTWVALNESDSGVNFIEFGTVNRDSVLIDGYMSENGIDDWGQISLSGFLAQSTMDPNVMFTNSGIGIGRRTTANGDWEAVNTGIEGITIWDTVNDPNNLDKIYITTSAFGRTENGGLDWEFPTGDLIFSSNALAVDPEVSGWVYAGDDTFFYRSANDGQNWESFHLNSPSAGAIQDMEVDPQNGENIFIGMARYDSVLARAVGDLSYSTNRGVDWEHTTLALPVNALEIGETVDGLMFYAGIGDCWSQTVVGGVYTSTDGINWSPAGLSDKVIKALAVDPNDEGTIYAGSYQGSWPIGEVQPLFKSIDKGENWVQLSLSVPGCENIDEIAVDPNNANVVIVSSCDKLYISIDGGAQWQLYYEGRPNEQFQSIYFPNQNEPFNVQFSTTAQNLSTIYLATSKGLYRSYEIFTEEHKVFLPMVIR